MQHDLCLAAFSPPAGDLNQIAVAEIQATGKCYAARDEIARDVRPAGDLSDTERLFTAYGMQVLTQDEIAEKLHVYPKRLKPLDRTHAVDL